MSTTKVDPYKRPPSHVGLILGITLGTLVLLGGIALASGRKKTSGSAGKAAPPAGPPPGPGPGRGDPAETGYMAPEQAPGGATHSGNGQASGDTPQTSVARSGNYNNQPSSGGNNQPSSGNYRPSGYQASGTPSQQASGAQPQASAGTYQTSAGTYQASAGTYQASAGTYQASAGTYQASGPARVPSRGNQAPSRYPASVPPRAAPASPPTAAGGPPTVQPTAPGSAAPIPPFRATPNPNPDPGSAQPGPAADPAPQDAAPAAAPENAAPYGYVLDDVAAAPYGYVLDDVETPPVETPVPTAAPPSPVAAGSAGQTQSPVDLSLMPQTDDTHPLPGDSLVRTSSAPMNVGPAAASNALGQRWTDEDGDTTMWNGDRWVPPASGHDSSELRYAAGRGVFDGTRWVASSADAGALQQSVDAGLGADPATPAAPDTGAATAAAPDSSAAGDDAAPDSSDRHQQLLTEIEDVTTPGPATPDDDTTN